MVMVIRRQPSQLRDIDEAESLLAPDELARMHRFAREADRLRYLTAWSLVRQTLADLTGQAPRDLMFDRTCTLCGHASHGKPRLVGSPWEFSLSHAGDRVLLALAENRPVGVDIEPVDAPIDTVAHLVLHPDDPPVTGPDLVRIWVRKEAVAKVTGHGLARPMTSFTASPAPPGLAVHDLPDDDGYVAALATISSTLVDLGLKVVS
jgi:Phosphopantetheinyl transferase